MEIRVDCRSDIAGRWSYVTVLLPPFPPDQDDQKTLLRSREVQLDALLDTLNCEASVESPHQVGEFSLTEDQVVEITNAVRAVRIAPSTGSFDVFSACDGWSTTLTLDAYDSKVVLTWFCNPPPEWIAVRELCDVIQRIAFTFKRQRGE